ncbi:MAG: SprB repeat-containing protein, partial [Bacteroidetes bacterium]|nr:SprB repeat-containing protein [Bacteroidota bacterium]
MRLKLSFILSVFVFLFSQVSSAQCGPGTPAFTVDLTGDPGGVWTSPAVVRNDNCCGSTSPDRCIKFNITLDSAAVGISFDIISGALPPGALYYQIGCGPLHLVGTPICLSGTGPHVLTFCKPGNNQNVYQISSIPAAVAGKDVSVNEGCTTQFNATGFNTSTITWHSIYPGLPGAYDSYLSCTSGCLNPTITPGSGHPPYVDYVVCGQPAANCNFQTVCDTVRAILNSTLAVVIVPINPTVCFGQTSTIITANGSGGTPPYTYLWNNVNPSQSINVGAGVFTVRLSDASNCPPTYASVTVTSFSVTISADAGPDDTVCVQHPVATLNASVTGASGGVWSGGAGVFSPNNTSLICTYTPTSAELANGFVDLRLITTGNGTCPADTDFVRIYYKGFTGAVTVTPVNVSCFGGNNGSATVNVTGGISPYSYFWNTAPAQTTATADNLPIGTYSVTIQNGIGCTLQTTVVITQPAPLAVNSVVTNVSCFGGSNGGVSLSPWGGIPSYTYLWQPGNQTGSSVTAIAIGTYSVTVRDSKNCQITATYAITQPPQLSVTLSTTDVSCFGGNDGSITSASAGGVAPYTYNWSPIGISSPNASGVFTGTYTVTITDNSGCTVSAAASITQPPVLGVLVSGTNEVCNYLNNGTAAASVSGGTPAYSYNWQPGGQTSGSVSNLSAGTYTLTVTDIKGCKTNSLITITEPPALAINFINKINVSCFGGNNGGVTANVMGGIPGYSYLWTPGSATTAAINNLLAGSYTLTATDNNGCEVQSSISITQPPVALSVTVSSTAVSCHGGANGTLSSSAAGGSMPYTYNWQPGNYTGSPIANLFAGTYTVTTTDANGCTIAQTVTITEPPVIDLTPASINSFCGAANGKASVSVSGGVSPYSYQ